MGMIKADRREGDKSNRFHSSASRKRSAMVDDTEIKTAFKI